MVLQPFLREQEPQADTVLALHHEEARPCLEVWSSPAVVCRLAPAPLSTLMIVQDCSGLFRIAQNCSGLCMIVHVSFCLSRSSLACSCCVAAQCVMNIACLGVCFHACPTFACVGGREARGRSFDSPAIFLASAMESLMLLLFQPARCALSSGGWKMKLNPCRPRLLLFWI